MTLKLSFSETHPTTLIFFHTRANTLINARITEVIVKMAVLIFHANNNAYQHSHSNINIRLN